MEHSDFSSYDRWIPCFSITCVEFKRMQIYVVTWFMWFMHRRVHLSSIIEHPLIKYFTLIIILISL